MPKDKREEFGYGDVWAWIGIDADTKLVVSFYVGERDSLSARDFIRDLGERLANRVQLPRARASLHALQLRANPQNATNYPGHASRIADHIWTLEEIAKLAG